MAISKTTGYDWITLDPSSLPQHGQEAYAAMKDARRIAAQARDVFETIMEGIMPDATFSYRFGKLSFTTDAPKAPKAPKAKATPSQGISLSDYLARAKAAVQRT